ncbi:zinc finger protein 260-like isoform X2 [Manduca sexta]|uniref:zinc finger protein 260-like isoform X2 n=1 Tax=Manduca sexta TaxID=7130 RepID=UPI00188E9FD7|nr:zinc finger protein 260-like isoform X2 [Manduca sexta]
MNDRNSSICRICLKDGASLPIFDSKHQEDIHSKISLCLKEKIEDTEGYPRCICNKCNETLDIICEFINKYRNSCKILQDGLPIVKTENTRFSDTEDYCNEAEIEIDVKKLKTDPHILDNETQKLLELIKPLQVTIKKIKHESKEKTTKEKARAGSKTNKIASSILEGEFSWTGEKCIKTSQATSKLANTKRKRAIQQKEIKKVVKPMKKKPNPEKLCDICGKVFVNSDKLLVHKKKVHFKNPVKCSKCPRILASEYYLGRHMKRKHESQRDFICSACGRGFVFKTELSSHFRKVHDKEMKPPKVFACKFCEKTYKCAKSVIVHERSAHTGHRPAECSICGSSFFHEDYLKEHMRLHTGETPFKCPVCGRGYAQRGNMKSHLRIHRISELDATTLSRIRPNYLKLLKV